MDRRWRSSLERRFGDPGTILVIKLHVARSQTARRRVFLMQPRDRPTCRAPHGKVTIEPSHMGSLRGGPMRQRAACNQRRCFKCGRNRQEFAHRLRVVLPIPKQCKILVEAILIAGMKDQPETFGRYRRGYLEIDFSPRFGIAIQDFIASLFVDDAEADARDPERRREGRVRPDRWQPSADACCTRCGAPAHTSCLPAEQY